MNPIPELPVVVNSIVPSDGLIQNEQGDVVAIVTDIEKKDARENVVNNVPPTLLSTASVLPPLIGEESTDQIPPTINQSTTKPDSANAEAKEVQQSGQMGAQIAQPAATRWSKDNRVILKQLMSSLPPHDVGAALRVILDTFGVESSKLIRRGDFIELDLNNVTDDYILDSLWNYCAQMQFNIMSTLQMQQQQQQAQQQMQYPQVPQAHMPQQQQQQMQQMQYQQQQQMQQLQQQAHAQMQQQQHAVPTQLLHQQQMQMQQQQQYIQNLPPQMVPQIPNENMGQQFTQIQNIERAQQ